MRGQVAVEDRWQTGLAFGMCAKSVKSQLQVGLNCVRLPSVGVLGLNGFGLSRDGSGLARSRCAGGVWLYPDRRNSCRANY